LAVLGILGKLVMYTLLAIVSAWLFYVFSMAVANTICECVRAGPMDIVEWIKKEGA
jgi:hypothetical protein